MNARVRVLFKGPTADDWEAMKSLGRYLTSKPESVAVSADDDPNWLIATFAMRTEPQHQAVDKVFRAIAYYCGNCRDSAVGFPYTEAQRARADRKNARQRAKRLARRKANG
jgi:hypothetical protein